MSNQTSLVLRIAFLACSACCIACGGDDGMSESRGPRLEWDQQAASLEEVRSLSFRLYVDDVGRSLNSAACGAATGDAGYVCSALLPQLGSGRRVLQLTSVLNGIESLRSEPLIVSGDTGQLAFVAGETGLTSAPEPESAIAPVPSTACLTTATTECYAVRVVASALSGVSALSPAPDGRLFFVEGQTRVRVVAGGALVPEPALALNDDQARIVGLAVDSSSFPETRFVFVAWTDETSPARLQLNVTRYREVANTLGEGATILTGIPVPRDVPPSIAVDRAGYVYVAVPALHRGSSSQESGVVLRITRDGRVPPDNALGLAAFAAGFSSPTSLSLDAGQSHLWLGGRDSGTSSELRVVSTLPSDEPPAIRVVTRVASDQPVSFVLSRTDDSSPPALFVLADGRLSKAIRAQDGSVAGYALLDLGQLQLTAAATTEAASIYIATDTAIFELLRQ